MNRDPTPSWMYDIPHFALVESYLSGGNLPPYPRAQEFAQSALYKSQLFSSNDPKDNFTSPRMLSIRKTPEHLDEFLQPRMHKGKFLSIDSVFGLSSDDMLAFMRDHPSQINEVELLFYAAGHNPKRNGSGYLGVGSVIVSPRTNPLTWPIPSWCAHSFITGKNQPVVNSSKGVRTLISNVLGALFDSYISLEQEGFFAKADLQRVPLYDLPAVLSKRNH